MNMRNATCVMRHWSRTNYPLTDVASKGRNKVDNWGGADIHVDVHIFIKTIDFKRK